jgi:hypothetical protein
VAVKRWRPVIGFIHRVTYAMLIGFITWFLWIARFDTLPFDRDIQTGMIKVLSFPVALVSEQTPITGWKAIDPFTKDIVGHNEPNEKVLLWHLRLAVPVYVVLFYLPNLGTWIIRRARRKRHSQATAPTVEQT